MNSLYEQFSPQDDITPDNANSLLQLHRDIMEIVVLGQDHQLIMDKLCLAAEQMIPDALASIMLFDKSHTYLEVIAAPSIPETAIKALNGLNPGTKSGSCGNAVFHNEPQFVCNTYEDPRWENVRQFARDFTIGACWSMPIRTTGNIAVGSFALSSFEKRPPTTFQIKLLETSAHIAGIILKRQLEEQQLWELAHFDPLTQTPNRLLLNQRLEQAIQGAKQLNSELALLFLDLDNFKDINDTYGHDIGDQILVKVSDRIKNCIDDKGTLARMGGDEFIILLKDIQNPAVIEQVTSKIMAAFTEPFNIIDQKHLITCSIGISIFPEHGDNAQQLQKNADTAMYAAKRNGRNCFSYYDRTLSEKIEARLKLSSDMRPALANDDFFLVYQPQYNSNDGTLTGVEALLRWQHERQGLIGPDIFIPVAETMDMIIPLGDWVIKHACEQGKVWHDAGFTDFNLAINLSVKQLVNNFAQHLNKIITASGFPTERVEVEITESLVIESNIAVQELQKIKALGITISMDDFGTGHSSLAQLKCLPISKLKIDRSFVNDLADDENDRAIIRTIIAMGHTLDLEIVAEGVETEQQLTFLINEGCDYLQGYLLNKPLSAYDIEKLLKNKLQNK